MSSDIQMAEEAAGRETEKKLTDNKFVPAAEPVISVRGEEPQSSEDLTQVTESLFLSSEKRAQVLILLNIGLNTAKDLILLKSKGITHVINLVPHKIIASRSSVTVDRVRPKSECKIDTLEDKWTSMPSRNTMMKSTLERNSSNKNLVGSSSQASLILRQTPSVSSILTKKLHVNPQYSRFTSTSLKPL